MMDTSFSVVFISFQRVVELAEAIRSIRRLDRWNELVREVVVVDNGPEPVAPILNGLLADDPDLLRLLVYGRPERDLGVSGGRNHGAAMAKSRYLLFLDDDAEFLSGDLLTETIRAFHELPRLGGLGYRSLNHSSREAMPNETPFHGHREVSAGIVPATNFIGVCHTVPADVFRELGGYPEHFFYGFEENDFCLRAIDAGYVIGFCQKVEITHKKSPRGRRAPEHVRRKQIENKLRLALRNLPLPHTVGHFVMWGAKLTLERRGDPRPLMETIGALARQPERRHVLSKSAIRYVRDCNGRLWY